MTNNEQTCRVLYKGRPGEHITQLLAADSNLTLATTQYIYIYECNSLKSNVHWEVSEFTYGSH